jgi:hypothetical protein
MITGHELKPDTWGNYWIPLWYISGYFRYRRATALWFWET